MTPDARALVVLVTAPEGGAHDLGRALVVPEVLAVPVETGSSDYLRWVQDSVAVEGR
jgi:hypothetical protein